MNKEWWCDMQLNVVITRKVPVLGWAMLVVALLAISASGVAMQLQGHDSMLLKVNL
jgi:hypothetical protein